MIGFGNQVEVAVANPLQVGVIQDNDVIQALSANRSDQAFAIGILPREIEPQ